MTLVFLGIAVVLFVHSLIIMQPHSWDVDALLYLASRLDNGELIYLRDFETKLPMLQYMFWVPNRMGGIGAWRLITFGVSFVLVFASTHFIVTSLREGRLNRRPSTKAVLLLSSVSMAFLYSLPGSSDAQISMLAAVLIYQAIALLHGAGRGGYTEKLYISLSAFCAAIAVSIRPNYLFTIPAIALFAAFVPIFSDKVPKHIYFAKKVFLFLLVFLLVTMAQFVPYLFYARGPSALSSALRAFTQFVWKVSLVELLKAEFGNDKTTMFYMLVYTGPWVVLFALLRPKTGFRASYFTMLAGVITCIVSIIALNCQFAVMHYWSHYSIMFMPYISLMAIYVFILIHQGRIVFTYPRQRAFSMSSLTIVGVLLAIIIAHNSDLLKKGYELASKTDRKGMAINVRNFDRRLLDFLRLATHDELTFLVTTNVNYHRMLNEPRIGDGHPFVLYFVLAGRRVGPVNTIFLYSDKVYDTPCVSLWESGKDLILVKTIDDLVVKCLTAQESSYSEVMMDRFADSGILPVALREAGPYRVFVNRFKAERVLDLIKVYTMLIG